MLIEEWKQRLNSYWHSIAEVISFLIYPLANHPITVPGHLPSINSEKNCRSTLHTKIADDTLQNVTHYFYEQEEENMLSQLVLPEKKKLFHVKTFKYYLDEGSPVILENMKNKDMVIVEPVVMEEKYIKEAQQSGTLIYGYINSMEADKWNEKLFKKFEEEDFYHESNGKKHYISKWDAYLMDITSIHYQEMLLNEIQKQIVDKNLDGVFLDTVGSIEDYHSEETEMMKEQQAGMKEFVQRVKQRFPELSIAQNWGFDTLEHYTAPYIDFVMWEDFSASKIENDDWSADKIKQLKQVRNEYGVEIFAVSFNDKKESSAIADRHGFHIYHNPEGSYYNKWASEEIEKKNTNKENNNEKNGIVSKMMNWIKNFFRN